MTAYNGSSSVQKGDSSVSIVAGQEVLFMIGNWIMFGLNWSKNRILVWHDCAQQEHDYGQVIISKKERKYEKEATIKLLSSYMKCYGIVEKWGDIRGRFKMHVNQLTMKV